MEPLIVYPENKEQATALKAVMKAMKIAFIKQDELTDREDAVKLPDHVVASYEQAMKEIDNGIGLLPYTTAKDMLNQP